MPPPLPTLSSLVARQESPNVCWEVWHEEKTEYLCHAGGPFDADWVGDLQATVNALLARLHALHCNLSNAEDDARCLSKYH